MTTMTKQKATLDITATNLQETIAKGIVLVDFSASWCGPCRAFAPVFERAAEKHDDIVFATVDTGAEPTVAAAFQIRAVPTLGVFRDGILLGLQPGALPAQALDELIAQVRGLDMADVKEEIAKKESV